MALSDIYQKASLVQIPSGYNGSTAKLYSVLPANGDGDFTVSADADATRIDENGLIETTVLNQARLSRNFIDGVVQPDPFLLLEPTRTNSLTYSEDFSNAVWSKANSSIEVNSITSPDGALSADKLIANTTTGAHYVQGTVSGLSTSSEATFSVFVKKGEITQLQLLCAQNSSPFTNWGRLQFDLNTFSEFSTNIGTFGYEDYGNGWVRVFVTGTPTSTSALIRVSLYKNFSNAFAGNNIDGFYVFGAQLEAGSYPTSYIPTTTAAVTRTADLCTNGGNSSLFNTNQGVLFAHLEGLADAAESNRYISLSNGSPSSSIMIQYRNSGELRLYNNGTGGSSLIFADYSADLTDIKKIAIQYGENTSDYKVYINGVSKTINTGFSATSISSLDEIDFDYPLGTLGFFGKIYQVMYFDTALTDSELQTLTSYDSFGQMAKALLYTIE